MKSKSKKILQIITGVFAALYLAGLISSIIDGGISFLKLNGILVILHFLLFLLGFTLSWTKEKIAAIIFMVWNAGVWILDLFHDSQDQGMLVVIAVPILVIGALLLLQWYKTTSVPRPAEQQQWKFILRVLLINYAVLYAILVITKLTGGEPPDYLSLPFVLFPLLLLVFLAGFVLSWKREFLAGFLFIFWYAIVLFGSIAYFEFFNSGPWFMFGLPILLQGLFYIKHHFQFKPKK